MVPARTAYVTEPSTGGQTAPEAIGQLLDRARAAHAADVRRNAGVIGAEIRRRREIASRDLIRILGDDAAAAELVDPEAWVLDRSWTWGPATYELGPLTLQHEAMPGANAGELYAVMYRGRGLTPPAALLRALVDVGRVLDSTVASAIDAELDDPDPSLGAGAAVEAYRG